jgi:hypothetical protein
MYGRLEALDDPPPPIRPRAIVFSDRKSAEL